MEKENLCPTRSCDMILLYSASLCGKDKTLRERAQKRIQAFYGLKSCRSISKQLHYL